MRYRHFLPGPELREYVESIWTIDSGGVPTPADAGTVLPDGGIELVLSFGGGFRDLPDRIAVGQLSAHARLCYEGATDLLGIRLLPVGAQALLRGEVQAITDRVLALDALVPVLDRALREEIDPQWASDRRRVAVEAILRRTSSHAREPDRLAASCVDLIRASSGRVALDALARRHDLSVRQMERRFLAATGVSPKLYCRVMRFQNAWLKAHGGAFAWADLAAACGYYDQSHLIRDFHHFAGCSPEAFLRART